MFWKTTRHLIDLSKPRVMGIVNLTPDSFSDGGHLSPEGAGLRHCERLISEGADMLDIGGESTRPGAQPITPEEEWHRVRPVLMHALTLGVPVSLDTRHAPVMQRGLDLGVDIINDVMALRGPQSLQKVAAHPSAGVCLMHMQGTPATMQRDPSYDDVVAEVLSFLGSRVSDAVAAGIERSRLVIDPGYGFGKTLQHNLQLAQHQAQLLQLGVPLLAGWSRKGTLGHLTGRPVEDRMIASVAAALAAVAAGARIVRVHDVSATVDALKVWAALSPTQAKETMGEGGRI
ncbi:MAG: dihydropteroate synthase [Pseudomonadota bacterium]|jgi:dihydropteroate synthase|nr:dihydropteroate synthase [Betaproteobacteria bacterium]